jgi:hypothetical protein
MEYASIPVVAVDTFGSIRYQTWTIRARAKGLCRRAAEPQAFCVQRSGGLRRGSKTPGGSAGPRRAGRFKTIFVLQVSVYPP